MINTAPPASNSVYRQNFTEMKLSTEYSNYLTLRYPFAEWRSGLEADLPCR